MDQENFSDIDIVIICKKLSKEVFLKCVGRSKEIRNNIKELKQYNIKINSTFGPLKFYGKKQIIIHLMIYDLKGHVKHVLKSPFTCFDWEKSKLNTGIPLKKICSVNKLQISDFIRTRRGTYKYLNDIKSNKISYRKYVWERKKYTEKEFKKKMNSKDQIEFCYHIIKNTLNNFLKYKAQKNLDEKLNTSIKLLKKIDKNLVKNYYVIRNYKLKKNDKINIDVLKYTEVFLNSFNKYLIKYKSELNEIILIRHQKTILNDGSFLGVKRNPKIIKNIKNTDRNIYDIIFTSELLRTIETSKSFKSKENIIINKNLNEIDYGEFEGQKFDGNNSSHILLFKKMSKNINERFINGESYLDVILRIKRFVQNDLIRYEKHKLILVITHNVFLRCLIGNYLSLKHNAWHLIYINHLKKVFLYKKKNKIFLDIDRLILKKVFLNNIKSLSS